MTIFKIIPSFLASALTTFIFAAIFYTNRVLAAQKAIGVEFTPAQQLDAYLSNAAGLASTYGLVLTAGLAIAFPIAAGVKRVLRPLAPIAFPTAGAVAVYTAIWLIENVVGSGGVGALSGARGAFGLGLQMLAGAIGGALFSFLVRR